MIAHRDLSVISNQFLKQNGGRRIPDQTMLDYALSWFLSELTIHGFGEGTAFKGGVALITCHFGEYRLLEDLDFTLLEEVAFDTVPVIFDEIGLAVEKKAGMSMMFV
ncbi:nucleotidyl transferase AbiEii/AbiGii toxin family protein [Rhizobium rosettiformans]|uniref:nucleotidyl transferase AbiEii/AbiGii toxin family protein n=1 Tax=Rhizobium rosettiformans TaxID=1368430 RepID=UPI00285C41F0|nr:nucleotidyl transferase AbiEii/AbiGii toxin family protein [Rhizobium rosettiformans]MDR7031021.1 putative nucleotidyltransferase component of viral defense system [Rhizobium rosettiformans]MDR7066760.1 putative nucleotidyltransferase component of viral defense system [Rhizobium rosettiformans]